MWLLLALAGALIAWVVLERTREIFCVSVRHGRCLVVRGRIAGTLLDGIADVVQRSRVQNATIRAVKGEHHARLVTRGLDEATTQRLRNVFGTHPVQKLRAAPVANKRNLGQLLGVTWLAWLLVELGRRNT